MSALSDLVYGKDKGPWPRFTEKYPVKTKIFAERALDSLLNEELDNDIKKAGDFLQGRTSAKCLMTKWDMHEDYGSFQEIGNRAIELADTCPVSLRTNTDGKKEKVPLYIKETWGLVYFKGDVADIHNHWPSLWSYTYCVRAEKCCSPLVFPTATKKLEIVPETGQMVLFPAWLMHEVPKHQCEHERVMVSGNLDVAWHLE